MTAVEWRLAEVPAAAEELERGGLDRLTARLLARRGVHDGTQAAEFLSPSLAQLHDPLRLAGLPEAVDRLAQASGKGETVVVVGDYDADGVTAVALLVAVLRACGIATTPVLPHRLQEGYGFQDRHVERAIALKAGLIVTVDCGVTAIAAADRAHRAGIDVIITDHHLPGEALPAGVLLVNPRQAGCTYPFRDLAGVGLAFKLAQAVASRLGREIPVEALLRIAALGTIADLVPLRGENRVIAALGLEALKATRSPGLKRLFAEAGLRSPFEAADVAYRIGPRLNAAGRLGSAEAALELLLTRDENRAGVLALELEDTNRQRQGEERRVVEEAGRLVEERIAAEGGLAPVIFEWSEAWHPGVVGIAAGRLARQWQRPTILLAVRGDAATGSGRSVPGLDLHRLVAREESRLQRFGGHAQAIGLSVEAARLAEVRNTLLLAAAEIPQEIFHPVMEYDADLATAEVGEDLWRRLRLLQPHGMGNPEPTFRLGPLNATAVRKFGDGHREITGRGLDGASVRLLAWRSQGLDLDLGRPFEILAAIERSGWNRLLQLRLLAARPLEGAA